MARNAGDGRRRLNGRGTVWEDAAAGRWRAQYYDRDGRRRTLSAATRAEVESRLTAALGARDEGRLGRLPTQTPSLGEWRTEWLEQHQHTLAPSTRAAYNLSVRRISAHLGDVRLDLLDARRIKGYQTKERTRRLSEGSLLNDFRVLRMALNAAVQDAVIMVNPADGVKAPRPTRRVSEPLTRDEVQSVLAAAKKKGHMVYALRRIYLTLGPRQGEVLALKWTDINLKTGHVRFARSIRRDQGFGRHTKAPKTHDGTRDLRLDEETLKALKDWRHGQRKVRVAAETWDDGDWIFTGLTGKVIEADRDYRLWQALLQSAGVRQVRLHDTRHMAGTAMNEIGTDARTIQAVLGHANVQTTLSLYVKPSVSRVAAAGQALADWYLPA